MRAREGCRGAVGESDEEVADSTGGVGSSYYDVMRSHCSNVVVLDALRSCRRLVFYDNFFHCDNLLALV